MYRNIKKQWCKTIFIKNRKITLPSYSEYLYGNYMANMKCKILSINNWRSQRVFLNRPSLLRAKWDWTCKMFYQADLLRVSEFTLLLHKKLVAWFWRSPDWPTCWYVTWVLALWGSFPVSLMFTAWLACWKLCRKSVKEKFFLYTTHNTSDNRCMHFPPYPEQVWH